MFYIDNVSNYSEKKTWVFYPHALKEGAGEPTGFHRLFMVAMALSINPMAKMYQYNIMFLCNWLPPRSQPTNG